VLQDEDLVIPTFRLLLLILPASLFAGASAAVPVAGVAALAYLLVVVGCVVLDLVLTPRPAAVEIERIHDARFTIGIDNLVTLLVANTSTRALQFRLRDGYPASFVANTIVLEGVAAGFGLAELRYQLRPPRRGDYTFGDVVLRYRGVLGLVDRQMRAHIPAEVKVFPDVRDTRRYDVLLRRNAAIENGLRRTRQAGAGSDFARLREYTTDDEFRRINWKATARRGVPIATEYDVERSRHILTVIDSGRLMAAPVSGALTRLDHAVNAALLLAYVALQSGDHAGALTFAQDVGAFLAPRRGEPQFARLLEGLYNVQATPIESDPVRALAYLERNHRRRSLVVIFTEVITLDAARPLIAQVALLARRHVPLCVVLADPETTRTATEPPTSTTGLYERTVADRLLAERRTILETMQRGGALTLDVPADRVGPEVIDTYRALKRRGAL
jgi:uncharacterized protein (DUF58 family)